MCDEDHQPHENPSKKRRAQHVDVRRPTVAPLQKQRRDHADAGNKERRYRSAAFAQSSQRRRSVAAACQREQHPRRQIEIAVHARERCSQHHKVHHLGGCRNARRFEHSDEWALAESYLRPRHDTNDHRKSANVKNPEQRKRPAHRRARRQSSRWEEIRHAPSSSFHRSAGSRCPAATQPPKLRTEQSSRPSASQTSIRTFRNSQRCWHSPKSAPPKIPQSRSRTALPGTNACSKLTPQPFRSRWRSLARANTNSAWRNRPRDARTFRRTRQTSR